MSHIKLAGAQWSWVGASLRESAGIYRALGIGAMDLITAPGMPLDVGEIESDPQAVARRVGEELAGVEVELVNLMTLIGADFEDRALNSPDEEMRRRNADSVAALCEFAAAAGLKSITLVPGVGQPGMSREDAQALAAEALRAAAETGASAGVDVVFEPHRESVLESPAETLAFMQQNPDLRICVDYSHCVSLGYREEELHPLLPYAGHVHLRQGAAGQIQARWDDGEIDFPGLMRRLAGQGYDGWATLEYEHEEVWDMDKADTMKETIRMRDAVLPFVSAPDSP